MGAGADTRERILQEALAVFARLGYDGARMDKIAAQVGINKASLYFHFKSKKDIFRELFKGITRKYCSKIKTIVSGTAGPTRQRLIEIYQRYLEYNWNNAEMDFWNRIYYLPPEPMKSEIVQGTKDAEAAFQKELISVFSEGIEQGDIKPLNPQYMAKTYYYLLTCIGMSTEVMDYEQGLTEMDACFSVFWEGVQN